MDCVQPIRTHRKGQVTHWMHGSRTLSRVESLAAAVRSIASAGPPILARAGDPLPSPLGTLDAIHLATALAWRDRMNESLTMATHDGALGLAARSY